MGAGWEKRLREEGSSGACVSQKARFDLAFLCLLCHIYFLSCAQCPRLRAPLLEFRPHWGRYEPLHSPLEVRDGHWVVQARAGPQETLLWGEPVLRSADKEPQPGLVSRKRTSGLKAGQAWCIGTQ